jgi:coenzyme F420 biosynthesis associated uncharacterized protein
METVIDWGTAEWVASLVAGQPARAPLPALGELAHSSEWRVCEYTGLAVGERLPPPLAVDRGEWIRANLESMRPMLDPLSEQVGEGLGPLGTPLRRGLGYLMAIEVGGLTGMLSQRVLGQYELSLLEPAAPARLLFVAPNLEQATRALDASREELLAWVAFHEVTHAVQFSAVPWLRDHVGSLLRALLDTIEVGVNPSRLLRLPRGEDVRGVVAAARSGELITLVAGPERRALIDRIQATMAVIEGYAEHVMDAVGEGVLPSVGRLRAGLDRRRRERPALLRVIERLLGFELKLRQYEEGRRFCDAAVAAGGIDSLNRVWSGPEALPDLAELRDPSRWLERVGGSGSRRRAARA